MAAITYRYAQAFQTSHTVASRPLLVSRANLSGSNRTYREPKDSLFWMGNIGVEHVPIQASGFAVSTPPTIWLNGKAPLRNNRRPWTYPTSGLPV